MHVNVCKAHLDMEFALHKLIIIIVVDLQRIKVAFLHIDLYCCFSIMSVIMHIIGVLHVLNLDWTPWLTAGRSIFFFEKSNFPQACCLQFDKQMNIWGGEGGGAGFHHLPHPLAPNQEQSNPSFLYWLHAIASVRRDDYPLCRDDPCLMKFNYCNDFNSCSQIL